MSTSTVATRDLGKIYRSGLRRRPATALEGVTLEVERGCIFGLLGQNGAGKTTLVKILLGLVIPTGGEATVLERPAGDARARRRIGYLPEAMRIPEYFRARSFLTYMGKLAGVDSATLDRRIPELLDLVGLPGEKKLLRAYSKGMQQRLGLAQSLINDPELLFLDEPTEGLDPLGRKQVRDLLVRLREQGKTIFLNSHLLSEVELVCDRLVILHRGAVARSGAPADFVRATGRYSIRIGEASEAARAAVAAAAGDSAQWNGSSVQVMPRDRAHLNAIIDRLRASGAELEAIEPLKSSLEEYFIEIVAGGGAPASSQGATR